METFRRVASTQCPPTLLQVISKVIHRALHPCDGRPHRHFLRLTHRLFRRFLAPRFLLSLIIFGRRFIVPTLTLSFRAVRSCTCAARKPRNLHCRDLPPQHPLAHHGRRQTNKAASQTYRCRLIPLLEFSEKPEASKFKHQMRKHAQNGKFRVAQTCPERSRMGPSPARVSIRHVFRRAESHQKNLCLEALGSAATVREPHSLCS